MNWAEVPLGEHVTEAAVVRAEAEVVVEFGEEARGWFRMTVFEDLKAEAGADRYFARAVEKGDGGIEATASGATPEAAATLCLRETGISLRRARGR